MKQIERLKSAFSSKTSKNAIWLISGKVIQMAISLVVSMLVARYLGPTNYGLINYATAYTGFFSAICTLGINSVIVKEFIDRKENEGTILGTALLLQGLSGLFSIITIVSIVLVVDKGEIETIYIVALTSLSLFFNVLQTINYWFQSKLQSKYTATATLCGFILTTIYRVFLLITQKSVYYFALISSVDYLLVGLFLVFFYFRKGGSKLSASIAYAKELLSKSCHFILPALMVSVYAQTDKIMLKQMISDAEIGYYATSVTICSLWCFILSAIIDSFAPSIMEYHKANNHELYIKRNKQLYCIVFYLSLFVSTIIFAFAPFIISVLYGKAYLDAAPSLRIITWYTAFSYLGVARNSWVVCENKQKYLIWVYCSSAGLNVLLNILFIPKLGASGAALASLLTQVITIIVVPFIISPLKENVYMMLDAIRFRIR